VRQARLHWPRQCCKQALLTAGADAEIEGFGNGHWSGYLNVSSNGTLQGKDFTLQLGCGYFLYTTQAGAIYFEGSPAQAQYAVLAPGWHLVGFPHNHVHAYDFLTGLLGYAPGGAGFVQINDPFNDWAVDDTLHGLGLQGTNFLTQAGLGYWIYTRGAGTLPATL
jgi:hypothetical protein